MKVRCVSDFYNEETRERLRGEGLRLRGSWHFKGSLTVGKEYLVLALTCVYAQEPDELGPFVTILPDVGLPVGFPLALFEVTDPRASRLWELRVDVDRQASATEVILSPPSFKATAYWDKLEQGEPSVEADFTRVLGLLEAEAADPSL
jgi:hypothetical protein